MNFIDLRSDTVTWPTGAMRKAMAEAEVGDNGYGDDPTTKELEGLAAEMTGKEASLFVPSGTFGNQLALFTHAPRGSEVILADQCHIVQHEAGAAAQIAGVQLRTIDSPDGILSPEEVENRIRPDGADYHAPPTGLIALENSFSSGHVPSIESMRAVKVIAVRHRTPVHLDGARLFNAAAALAVEAKVIARECDSVMFCLSKGLCAPVGSMLAGSRDFIRRARFKQKVMGGVMRQSGVLAAAGLIALREMSGRLAEDHETARYLAGKLQTIEGVAVHTESLRSNLLHAEIEAPDNLPASLAEQGILINPPHGGVYRFVTHYWIGKEDIDKLVMKLSATLSKSGPPPRKD